ncbi:MAG: hypothetical protein ACM3NH_02580 [Candidatus Saccharibacteria bacterium]
MSVLWHWLTGRSTGLLELAVGFLAMFLALYLMAEEFRQTSNLSARDLGHRMMFRHFGGIDRFQRQALIGFIISGLLTIILVIVKMIDHATLVAVTLPLLAMYGPFLLKR